MCTTQPGMRQNNTIPLREAQAFNNRQNSYLPTERKWIDSEIIMNPRKIRNNEAFANQLVYNDSDRTKHLNLSAY